MPEGSKLCDELGFELAVAGELPPKVQQTAALLPTTAILNRSDLLAIGSHRPAKYFCDVGRCAILSLPYVSSDSADGMKETATSKAKIRLPGYGSRRVWTFSVIHADMSIDRFWLVSDWPWSGHQKSFSSNKAAPNGAALLFQVIQSLPHLLILLAPAEVK